MSRFVCFNSGLGSSQPCSNAQQGICPQLLWEGDGPSDVTGVEWGTMATVSTLPSWSHSKCRIQFLVQWLNHQLRLLYLSRSLGPRLLQLPSNADLGSVGGSWYSQGRPACVPGPSLASVQPLKTKYLRISRYFICVKWINIKSFKARNARKMRSWMCCVVPWLGISYSWKFLSQSEKGGKKE